MVKFLFGIFGKKEHTKDDFSAFFNNSQPEEKKSVLEEVVRKANQDQKDLIERHKRLYSNAK